MHDVVIAGGGPVGAALALSLRDSGLDVAVVDSAARADESLRPVALSHAGRLILDRTKALAAGAGTPIHSVHVSQSGGFGRTLIRREELDVPALGYVFNLGDLAQQLKQALGDIQTEGRVTQWQGSENEVQIQISRETETMELKARLLVIADGGQNAGDDLALRDYHQTAIVAAIRSEEAPQGRAWERFCADGPLALLPLGDRYALVWSMSDAHARDLRALGDEAFLQALQQAFGYRLGRFIEAGPRTGFPLQLRFRSDPVAAARTLIIGNAAQTLHPVAGQGLNLGLRDAFELKELLCATPKEEIGTGDFLARYRQRRATDRGATIRATDSLVQLFSADQSALRPLRGAALAALDLFPPLRRVFARRMVYGLRNLP